MAENRIRLSNRLQAAADFVSEGEFVADIGTDHGYLPLWLLQSGRCSRAVASDINRAPLQKAINAAKEIGEDRIQFVLTDGLINIPETVDTVVSAGMGGETIAAILEQAQWLKNGKKLVLQPMSKEAELCLWLYENGFYVEEERLCMDAGTIYRVLLVRPGVKEMPEPGELYVGKALFERKDELAEAYADRLCAGLERAVSGMKSSSRDYAAKISEAESVIKYLKKMKTP